MIELSNLLAKYKNLGSQRTKTLEWIQESIRDCCSISVPTEHITYDQKRGDVWIAVSGPKRIKILSVQDELSKRISERFGEAYKVR